MPTENRLGDTLAYLRRTDQPGLNLTAREIELLATRIREYDRIRNGAALSLNWSWYNVTRPGNAMRKAIRAYILISMYTEDNVIPATLAGRLRTIEERRLNEELSTKIKAFVAEPTIFIRAVGYTLDTPGSGTTRAKGRGLLLPKTVPLLMGDERLGRCAVMLIDMQTNGREDSGPSVHGGKMFDGKGHIDRMAEVLTAAGVLGMRVYEIVIDKDAAVQGGREGVVKTIPSLKRVMPRTARFMPKPFYNSFQETPLADWLQEDRIQTVIVMGYDANLCVKNTIFGTPEAEETVGERRRTPSEAATFLRTAERPDLYTEKTIPPIVDKRKRNYLPGLLDLGYTVITSRAIIASGISVLEHDYGPIAGL